MEVKRLEQGTLPRLDWPYTLKTDQLESWREWKGLSKKTDSLTFLHLQNITDDVVINVRKHDRHHLYVFLALENLNVTNATQGSQPTETEISRLRKEQEALHTSRRLLGELFAKPRRIL